MIDRRIDLRMIDRRIDLRMDSSVDGTVPSNQWQVGIVHVHGINRSIDGHEGIGHCIDRLIKAS